MVFIDKPIKICSKRKHLRNWVLPLLISAGPLCVHSQVHIDKLAVLPATVQNEINQLCLPAQYRHGDNAYRDCVLRAIEYRASDSAILLESYSPDEKYAIQQSCGKYANSGADYLDCVSSETKQLDALTVPDLSGLDEDEKNAIYLHCFDAQKSQGAAGYRACTNAALVDLRTVPKTDLSTLPLVTRNDVKQQCVSSTEQLSPRHYRLCLAEAFAHITGVVAVKPASEVLATAESPDSQQTMPTEVADTAPATSPAAPDKSDQTIARSETADSRPNQSTANSNVEHASTSSSAAQQPGILNGEAAIVLPTQPSVMAQQTPTLVTAPEQQEPSSLNPRDERAADASQQANPETSVEEKEVTQTQSPLPSEQNIDHGSASTSGGIVTHETPPSATQGNLQPPSVQVTSLENSAEGEHTASPEAESPVSSTETFGLVDWLRDFDARKSSDYLMLILPLLIILLTLKLLWSLLAKRNPAEGLAPAGPNLTQPQTRIAVDAPETRVAVDNPLTDASYNPVNYPPVQQPKFQQPPIQDIDVTPRSTQIEPAEIDAEFSFLVEERQQQSKVTWPPETATDAEALDPAPLPAETTADNTDAVTAVVQQPMPAPMYVESEFGQWIQMQPAENRKRLCTEFILYWVAYGSGHYPSDLKARLLEAEGLNEHDLIKKWVLEQNPSALVDALQRIWSLFSQVEIEQTISMIFAVLVKQQLSPVQNTFLRFFADFANIDSERLHQLHKEAFGIRMPPLPRPDDLRWWHREVIPSHADTIQFDPVSVSEREHCLSLLGLRDPAATEAIKNAYAQIADRCDLARFDELGEKERALIARHLEKYTKAYHFLMEEQQS